MPTDEELGRLYDDYRGEAYFKQRNHFEPWYTREFNDALGAEAEMQSRRDVLANVLVEGNLTGRFGSVLDYGGDRGQMLSVLNATMKSVYDISGVAPDPGVIAIDEEALQRGSWDLILCCHVLEHLPDPRAHVQKLLALGHPGTAYFFEVPNENFHSVRASSWLIQKTWLTWLVKYPWLFRKFDFLSRNLDYHFHFVPPVLFFPLCEHLNFFTCAGITSFLKSNGFKVESASVRDSGHIAVLARWS
ncbi:class I SAM-dependent methyltransferase [Acidocella sp.]|uniref:class I SAM-dependent methyltransferase n=1 Tax=Acidocella sp. TaxID=50710 RepID=UPI003D05D9C1